MRTARAHIRAYARTSTRTPTLSARGTQRLPCAHGTLDASYARVNLVRHKGPCTHSLARMPDHEQFAQSESKYAFAVYSSTKPTGLLLASHARGKLARALSRLIKAYVHTCAPVSHSGLGCFGEFHLHRKPLLLGVRDGCRVEPLGRERMLRPRSGRAAQLRVSCRGEGDVSRHLAGTELSLVPNLSWLG
eukprot:4126378-Pleurochrysis_carterae.AAC.1